MFKAAAAFALTLFLSLSALAEGKTVLDGVYSEAQTLRGQTSYTAMCSGCHGKALEGVSAPELTGNRFIERWREGALDGMYNFIRQRMPLGRPANLARIPDNEYLDILIYILKMNGYPAGERELTPEMLSDILFVGKTGPRPVPDGALIITVGCLSQNENGGWMLLTATEPARTRSENSTPEEVKTSAKRSLGMLTFRLAELDAVPDFAPDAHKGHKMQAKGYLVRQPNAERISLSSMEMVDAVCER
jgi:hypothetical protein